jgi:hypothetical protein
VAPGRALAAVGLLFAVCALGAPAQAAPPDDRGALLFLIDRVSFEEVMSVPEFAQLARSGGASLMTTPSKQVAEREKSSYLTIGNGTAAAIPGRTTLLIRALIHGGVNVCPGTGAQVALITGRSQSSRTEPCRRAPSARLPAFLVVQLRATLVIDRAAPYSSPSASERARRAALREAGLLLRGAVEASSAGRLLVVVATPQPSFSMDQAGDEVTPLFMAVGSPDSLFGRTTPARALTSESTRQDGLVSNVDVAPTILRFFGLAVPSDMDGSAIRVSDVEPPFNLHLRHLEQRRTRLPVQLWELTFVVLLGVIGFGSVIAQEVRGAIPDRLRALIRYLTICGPALLIPVLAGGLLPRFTYAWELPFLAVVSVVLGWLAVRARFPGAFGPFFFLGLAGLAFLVVDGAVGGRAFRTPLLGGTMFDGVRFFGLPNAHIALLLASALFVAAAVQPRAGLALLIGAGLFAGFPALGANIGASITLFFAAGLWWVLRTRRRIGIREIAVVAGVTLVGLGAVLLANRALPGAQTHATRFVERAGSNTRGAVDIVRHRLGVGVRQVTDQPATLIPLLGLPIVLGLALAAPGAIGRGLGTDPHWRIALIVMTAAGIVAFAVNDTGAAAASPVFLPTACLLIYAAMVAGGRPHRAAGEAAGRADEREAA